jgi:Kef-type K+ transport system membrane component KefB
LHGRIIIGILLVQDLAAIIAISTLSTIDNLQVSTLLIPLAEALCLILIAYACQKFFFPKIFRYAARFPELLLLLSLTVCFAFSLAFAQLGFSIAIGGFIAGVTLGNLPYNVEINAKVKPLKDFFSLLFFVAIGAHVVFLGARVLALPLIVLVMFSILVVPIVTMMVCTLFGYPRRTAFLAGISLFQISEFSLIIALHGKRLGHIGDDILVLAIWLAIITMTLTAYALKYDDWLYKRLGKFFGYFEIYAKKRIAPVRITQCLSATTGWAIACTSLASISIYRLLLSTLILILLKISPS